MRQSNKAILFLKKKKDDFLMIKYSKFLVYSLLILSASFSYSSQMDDLPKYAIKDMIIKYQIDETSIYLAKLLSLSRTAIKNKIDQSFEKYKDELEEYSNSGQYHAQD